LEISVAPMNPATLSDNRRNRVHDRGEKTNRLSFRMRPAERKALERLAARNERSIGAEVRRAIQRYVAVETYGDERKP
jgi:tRNA U34 5-methylaminomethyl-2-thiouridine-forming methyltransferase MnmC